MLALGIGVNTAIFSIFYGVLLRPLPYDHPERLALIWTSFRTARNARAPVSGTILGEIERRNRSLAGVAGIWTVTRTFTGDDPEQVKCARVTVNFFDVLGSHAAHGRTFVKEDNGGPAIMLTDGFFRRRFAGDDGLVGKGLPMDRANALVGVLPADFRLGFTPDSNVPADVQVFDTFGNGIYAGRKEYYIRVVARLKPGVSMNEAQRDLDQVAAEIGGAYAEYATENLRFTLAGMQADAVRDVRPALNSLFSGSACKEYYIRVVARLKPGVSMNEAQRDLDRVAAEIGGAYAEYATENRFTLAGMQAMRFATFGWREFVVFRLGIYLSDLLRQRGEFAAGTG